MFMNGMEINSPCPSLWLQEMTFSQKIFYFDKFSHFRFSIAHLHTGEFHKNSSAKSAKKPHKKEWEYTVFRNAIAQSLLDNSNDDD